MPVFAVIPPASDSSSLDAVVEKILPSPADEFKLASNSGWLVVFDGTTKAVCDHIGITGQPKGILLRLNRRSWRSCCHLSGLDCWLTVSRRCRRAFTCKSW